jgi:hypothetical protein
VEDRIILVPLEDPVAVVVEMVTTALPEQRVKVTTVLMPILILEVEGVEPEL